MPLDRRITVRLQAEGTRSQGEYVPGPVTEYPVWAQQQLAGSSDTVTEQGVVVVAQRRWIVRYVEVFATHPISRMTVDDEHGQRWNVENVQEGRARRRFLEIEAIARVAA